MLSISYPSPGVFSYNTGDTVDVPATISGGTPPYSTTVQFKGLYTSPGGWTVDPPRGVTVGVGGSLGGVVESAGGSPPVSPPVADSYSFRAKVIDHDQNQATVSGLILHLT
jgi:hypothetical protein